MERWGREASSQTETMRSIRELLAANTSMQTETMRGMGKLVGQCREFNTTVNALREHCQAVQDKAEKQSGIRGMLDWMFEKAQQQPMAFALVFVTSVSLAILAAVLGWDLPSLIAKLSP
jgi:hypothetical protein